MERPIVGRPSFSPSKLRHLTHDVFCVYLLLFVRFEVLIQDLEYWDNYAFVLPFMTQQEEDFNRVCSVLLLYHDLVPQNHKLKLLLHHVSEPP